MPKEDLSAGQDINAIPPAQGVLKSAFGQVSSNMAVYSGMTHVPDSLKLPSTPFQAAQDSFDNALDRIVQGFAGKKDPKSFESDWNELSAALKKINDASPGMAATYCLRTIARLPAGYTHQQDLWNQFDTSIDQIKNLDTKLGLLEDALTGNYSRTTIMHIEASEVEQIAANVKNFDSPPLAKSPPDKKEEGTEHNANAAIFSFVMKNLPDLENLKTDMERQFVINRKKPPTLNNTPETITAHNWSTYMRCLMDYGDLDPSKAAEKVSELLSNSSMRISPYKAEVWGLLTHYMHNFSTEDRDGPAAKQIIERLWDRIPEMSEERKHLKNIIEMMNFNTDHLVDPAKLGVKITESAKDILQRFRADLHAQNFSDADINNTLRDLQKYMGPYENEIMKGLALGPAVPPPPSLKLSQ